MSNKTNSIKQQLEIIKQRKGAQRDSVVYIRVSTELRDTLTKQLEKDKLSYKDLLVAATNEYLGTEFRG